MWWRIVPSREVHRPPSNPLWTSVPVSCSTLAWDAPVERHLAKLFAAHRQQRTIVERKRCPPAVPLLGAGPFGGADWELFEARRGRASVGQPWLRSPAPSMRHHDDLVSIWPSPQRPLRSCPLPVRSWRRPLWGLHAHARAGPDGRSGMIDAPPLFDDLDGVPGVDRDNFGDRSTCRLVVLEVRGSQLATVTYVASNGLVRQQ